MPRFRLLLLLLAPLPATAQPAAPPTTPARPEAPRTPEARRAELDRAFDALRTAPDEAGAQLVATRIQALWTQGASPSALLLLRRALRNIQANEAGEALEDCDAAITLAPDFAEAWHLRAQAFARSGDPAAAARDLQETLRLEPRHWPALVNLAGLQEEGGDAAAALRSLRAALAINPHLSGGAARLRDLTRAAEGDAL